MAFQEKEAEAIDSRAMENERTRSIHRSKIKAYTCHLNDICTSLTWFKNINNEFDTYYFICESKTLDLAMSC